MEFTLVTSNSVGNEGIRDSLLHQFVSMDNRLTWFRRTAIFSLIGIPGKCTWNCLTFFLQLFGQHDRHLLDGTANFKAAAFRVHTGKIPVSLSRVMCVVLTSYRIGLANRNIGKKIIGVYQRERTMLVLQSSYTRCVLTQSVDLI
jgi:hypothetical protein